MPITHGLWYVFIVWSNDYPSMGLLTRNRLTVNLEGEQPQQNWEISDLDRGLQQYRAHLDASQDTYNALCSDIIDLDRTHNALAMWFQILRGYALRHISALSLEQN